MFPSTSLARAVVDGLLRAGVRHAVLAPGSRSAPLAYELQEADRAGRLELHVRVDERAAGFLALGLAKVARVPAAVVTTSGTAVANLHPAVLEAHHGLVPLVVLSADRPPELRGIGANQTTVQPGMFGSVVRGEVELDPDEGDPACWTVTVQDLVARAVGAATTAAAVEAPPGPVHLDLTFREPLVPDLAESQERTWPETEGSTWARDRPAPDRAAITGPQLRLPDRTIVVIGDLPEPGQARRVARWAEEQGLPVVAEPFGEQPLGATVVAHGPLLLDTGWFAAQPPEHVVVAGRVTLSRPVRRLLTADPARVTYLSAGPRWLGPSFDAGRTLDLDAVLEAPALTAGSGRRDWLRGWREAAAAVSRAVAAECAWGSGPALARVLASALPGGARLVVGSSNAVRDLDLGVDWAAARGSAEAAPVADPGHADAVRVVANRGLAGIDGIVSTAAGVALAGGGATYALVGDLTFLHDVGALLVGPLERRPDLTVVVVNDDGGGIFATLEPGEPERAADFERVFGTPTGARIEDLARAYSVGYARITSPAELVAAVERVPEGLRIIEAILGRGSHRPVRRALREAAERATAPLRPDAGSGPPAPGRPDRDYPERGMRI
ncbi:2-succinyl-5-enolpyruvyl-6-hydroxy-3-cyclohexene-1-carboxylic-acid synthase [Nostocoides sp. F2B08]|uniref:2-succinyl-5-enolpyruvyl-6-hydroxy-3- cyclohexene-1-carboxylic-acid synthase n=1 Tax=Nostocoides sp. F2B08 TaxID=2653936 RepID=UPI001262B941|nr:2-succinyl-5-enolpyruvyl-6-hydroxy-3-cyclohexene-1-carboxylic-acid synthase [Tetrasphaera sp. F2B08]KAB7746436.1 2-succinyl-5-enolpyruvyl-6-hydroxy-3-cyclohexene-1-carboxylic-acid synthase [Tetrasphaera sp. F2B08]